MYFLFLMACLYCIHLFIDDVKSVLFVYSLLNVIFLYHIDENVIKVLQDYADK